MTPPNLIARGQECAALQRCMDSHESEFAIVCGRRRIGKTYLVEKFFNGQYDFKYVGGHNLRTREQLCNFKKALEEFSEKPQPSFKSWIEAFDALKDYLSALPKRRKVIFIDEMPWIDTKRSNFVAALENFWNGWAKGQYNIVLVATGSATSWMSDKLVKNKGGLHNRIDTQIYIKPFSLKETEEYLSLRNCVWDRFEILQCYMLTGGVPYYLKLMDPSKTVAENIDHLCFTAKGALRMEFEQLYSAIFSGVESYLKVVKALVENRNGLNREEISKKTRLSGTHLTNIIANLERCDFIGKRTLFGNRKTESVYRMIDFYTLFYYKFLRQDAGLDEQWWTHHLNSSATLSWQGITFELICMEHHRQIKTTLGINGMATTVSTWRCAADAENDMPGAQIDMIIERADRLIHLCEMKFSSEQFNITSAYEKKLRDRMSLFRYHAKTTKPLVHTFVTTFGVGIGKHKSIVHSEVTMDDLFNS